VEIPRGKDAKTYQQRAALEAAAFTHFECAELRPYKLAFETAIESGVKVPCPSCGLAGVKDGACAHMTCPRCDTLWCYLCGLDVKDCDKPQGTDPNSIYQHNVDWETNPRRCPMWLDQVNRVDSRWPADADGAVAKLSQIRTLRNLQVVVNELGPDMMRRLKAKYSSVRNTGYDLDRLGQADVRLIVRN